jgi:hypothetical protein
VSERHKHRIKSATEYGSAASFARKLVQRCLRIARSTAGIHAWAPGCSRRACIEAGRAPEATHQAGHSSERSSGHSVRKEARADHVAELVARTQSARSLIVQMPEPWRHPGLPTSTSAAEFQEASAYRGSGLSGKRNLGLLLARLHGWSKIAFVDDDVEVSRPDHIARLAGQLDEHQVVGMVVREFPDNSVVCHARRLARFSQDVFATGAALGTHCNRLPLSFFPDIYNDDWFFFAKEAAGRRLLSVGNATQAEYDPFQSPDRARGEEFGDLLAEGLYALIGEEDASVPFEEQLSGATILYWSRFIEARREAITEAKTVLDASRISILLTAPCALHCLSRGRQKSA